MKKSKGERVRRRKEYLYEQNPNCPDCGVKMILPPKGVSSNSLKLATIEHENNKYHPEKRYKIPTLEESRKSSKDRTGRTHLLCKKCNNGKAGRETRSMPKEELWKRSGRAPQIHA